VEHYLESQGFFPKCSTWNILLTDRERGGLMFHVEHLCGKMVPYFM
jgi:hypothetical protein